MAELIEAGDPATLDRAVAVLEGGGVVVIPTDTVYGLAALPSRPAAIRRIFALKGRPEGMHLAVLVADENQAAAVARISDGAAAVMRAFWPGALTVVLPATDAVAGALGADDHTVGVRCPDDPLIRRLAARVGPVAATSANLHGEPTPSTAGEVAVQLGGVDLVIDGGVCSGGVASTVVDATGDSPQILRAGPIGEPEIAAAWPPPAH